MTFAVFFPSLMGAGIIASGAVLLSDLVLRLLPGRGRRRSLRVALGAHGVVAAAAAAAGRRVRRSELLDRAPRRRSTYAALTLVACGAGVGVVSACVIAYRDEIGLFHRSPWMVGIAIVAGSTLAAVAILTGALGVLGSRLPWPLRAVVTSTFLGRLQIPVGAIPAVETVERGRES